MRFIAWSIIICLLCVTSNSSLNFIGKKTLDIAYLIAKTFFGDETCHECTGKRNLLKLILKRASANLESTNRHKKVNWRETPSIFRMPTDAARTAFTFNSTRLSTLASTIAAIVTTCATRTAWNSRTNATRRSWFACAIFAVALRQSIPLSFQVRL